MGKIDKKACREFLDPKLGMDTDNGLLYTENIKYIIRTSIKIVGHRRLLILYLYRRQDAAQGVFKPALTMFQASDDFITYEHGEGTKGRWRTSMLENLERDYRFESKCAFYTRTDEQRAIRFCHTPSWVQNDSGFTAINRKQSSLREIQAKKRQKKRAQKIVDRMKPLKPIGKRVLSWVRRDLLPKYLFYNYKKGKKPVPAHCTACGKEVIVTDVRHNKRTVCPSCHSEATMKSRGKATRLWDRLTAQAIQQLPDGELVIRILKAECFYRGDDPQFSIMESARYFVRLDAEKRYRIEPYYYSFGEWPLTPWHKGNRPVFSYYQQNYLADPAGHLYTDNLADALNGTPWQYCQIVEFYQSHRMPMDAETYLREYLRRPMIEYLVKLRLYQLAGHVVYRSNEYIYARHPHINLQGKNLREVLGVGKEDISLLQDLNVSYSQLGLLQGMRRIGLQPDRTLLAWCGDNDVGTLNSILIPLKYTTAHKLMRYMEEQFERYKCPKDTPWGKGYQSISTVLSDYRDYLCMCEGQRYDMSSSFVLFPRNLLEAHDQVMDLSDSDKARIYDNQIANQYNELLPQYQFSTKRFMIVLPKTAAELTKEGQKLHHCVGGYVKRVAMRECTILFLRKASAPDQPFCTIEIADNRVVQARGMNNKPLPPDADKFLEQWKARVLQVPMRAAA